jgi:UDP-N-acetylmuramoyl-L-alanyl-D-glutamate--2,6-diaminopimelate ligase
MALPVSGFHFDSRKVGKGDLFVAVRGTVTDGHLFIAKAIEQGAVAVVCEELPQEQPAHVTFVKVKDAHQALAHIAANWNGNPADDLVIVGITGTNGKTTTATLLWKLLNAMGHKAGLLSTVAVFIGEEEHPATHTTPDPVQLHGYFRKMVDAGCRFCFMEVSSHALVQHRVEGIHFRGAVFTNITHDHLDYHKTFKEYIAAKKLLFDGLGENAFALVNLDDANGKVMLQNCKGSRHGFALRQMTDFKARIVENTFHGLLLDVDGSEVWFRLIGSFNAYNLLGVYGTAVLLGFEKELVLQHLSALESAPGRFQTVAPADRRFTAIVDYAHTPDALKNVLQTIGDIRSGNGKVITVVGCGGNRDKEKRPVMAMTAAELSDQVILTSDNPRNEEPADILADMMRGISPVQKRKVLTIENRREAIRTACALAQQEDIILVAGKGHENYQEIKGVKHPFDDRQVLLETFNTLNA